MTVTGQSTDEIGEKMTDNCRIVSQWMMGNKLKLNADKTHLMTVGTSRRLQSLPSQVAVEMDGYILEESPDKFETLLGCQIEPDLKWHKQVEEVFLKTEEEAYRFSSHQEYNSSSSSKDHKRRNVHQCLDLLPSSLWWM